MILGAKARFFGAPSGVDRDAASRHTVAARRSLRGIKKLFGERKRKAWRGSKRHARNCAKKRPSMQMRDDGRAQRLSFTGLAIVSRKELLSRNVPVQAKVRHLLGKMPSFDAEALRLVGYKRVQAAPFDTALAPAEALRARMSHFSKSSRGKGRLCR